MNPLESLRFPRRHGPYARPKQQQSLAISTHLLSAFGSGPGRYDLEFVRNRFDWVCTRAFKPRSPGLVIYRGCTTHANIQCNATRLTHPTVLPIGGWGWFLRHGEHPPVVGHDGATFGQCCALTLVPEQNLALAVQTNCLKGAVLKTVFKDVMTTLAGITLTPVVPQTEPIDSAIDLDSFTGTYDSFDGIITISLKNNTLVATREDKVQPSPPENWQLKPVDAHTVVVYSAQGESQGNLVFY